MASDIEIGKVKWLRDLDMAKMESKKSGKAILVLFQEIPGCSTCKNYGSQVLSHPLIVEAIETYFIPLCIHNNKNGKDKEALVIFSEPAWNNPVIRIVNSDLKPVVERLNANYSEYGLVSKINSGLIKMGITIPMYLNLLEEEMKAKYYGVKQSTFGMYCFWTGEKTFGKFDGVMATKAGYMNGSEVVEVSYNPNTITLEELILKGKQNNSAERLFIDEKISTKSNIPIKPVGNFRVDPENKYYLFQTDYKFIPMTALQATRINSLLSEGKSCDYILSMRQLDRLKLIRSSLVKPKNMIGMDLITAWYN
jgi:hypothetical protein